MKILGNLIWLIFGGIIIAIEYFIGSIILMLTIVGILSVSRHSKWERLPSGHLAGIHVLRKEHQDVFIL
jgi:uncharacterized membrane protein YccF (DUF307 family)